MGIIHEARGFRVWKVLLSHSFTLTDTSLPESTAKLRRLKPKGLSEGEMPSSLAFLL